MGTPSIRKAKPPRAGQDLGPFTEDLRQVLRAELLRGSCTGDTIAALFAIHRRTLHRYLNAEGYTFRQVADEIRFEFACLLLVETDLTLSQVAAILNYSELSAFTRAFERWSGQPRWSAEITGLARGAHCPRFVSSWVSQGASRLFPSTAFPKVID
jgi:AraC-like DNA-binding protein